MLNGWNIEVNKEGMPQKVATAFGKLNAQLVGAEYDFIAYLGRQVVNGTNHAVLAKQTLTTGRDTVNAVVVIFNERPGADACTLAGIERAVEGGTGFGGVKVAPEAALPEDAASAWNEAFDAYVGAKVEPVALLATQVVNGVNFIYAATVTPVAPDAQARAVLVTVNPMAGTLAFADLLGNKHEASLGYAFTWLKGGLGKPLGEWP